MQGYMTFKKYLDEEHLHLWLLERTFHISWEFRMIGGMYSFGVSLYACACVMKGHLFHVNFRVFSRYFLELLPLNYCPKIDFQTVHIMYVSYELNAHC